MRINAAQSILFALGVHFPLYSENKQSRRNASYTKAGPGRRHHTSQAEFDVRRARRALARQFCQSSATVDVYGRFDKPGASAFSLWVRRRPLMRMWQIFAKGGKLWMRTDWGVVRAYNLQVQ